jgi:hypothetical protein
MLHTFFPLTSTTSIYPKIADRPLEHQPPNELLLISQSASAGGDIIRFITSGILHELVVNGNASVELLRIVQDNLSAGPLSVFPFPAPCRCYAAS